MECGWNKMNSYTGKIPIQLEHIDGNSENNELSNLKLLCPNCHTLTPTWGGANKGNGRKNRRKK
jgi:5-methylcytosine-specific restriction endonuclease McrA